MLMYAADLLAPHYCISCGDVNGILCVRCMDDITSEPLDGCVVCRRVALRGVCDDCKQPYTRAWCAGERREALRVILDAYKFERMRDAHRYLAMILTRTLPVLPDDTVVTYVPTIAPHVRQRGYDHAALIARSVASQRTLPCRQLLRRVGVSVQLGSTRKQREEQARIAFRAVIRQEIPETVLLIDDVLTTGATLRHAARTLKDAGVKEVWVAVVARQPLDG